MKEQDNYSGVFQLKDGNWGYRITFWIDGKKIDRRKRLNENGEPFLTKDAAIKARMLALKQEKVNQEKEQRTKQRIERALESLSFSPKTFADVYNEYCEKGRNDRAFGTIRKQDSIWNIHLNNAFGKRFIDDVTTAEIQDYLQDLYYVQGYAFRYVESFLKMFYLLFGQAYSRNYLSIDVYNRLCKNKDTKIHMPKLKIDEDMDVVVFTNEECAILDEYFHDTNAETAYLLGRHCGLRINEAYGLRWDDVDLDNKVLHIRQQMSYQNGLIKLVPLKTRNARRDIYLNSIIYSHLCREKEKIDNLTELQTLRREQNQKLITNQAGEKVSSLELVNCLLEGKIQTVNSMKYHSCEIKRRFGILFKFHYLRHTYGTQLADLNTPAHILCNQMGHGNIHVTEKYYISLSQNGIEVLKRNLEQL